jgi:hypothetical protein
MNRHVIALMNKRLKTRENYNKILFSTPYQLDIRIWYMKNTLFNNFNIIYIVNKDVFMIQIYVKEKKTNKHVLVLVRKHVNTFISS